MAGYVYNPADFLNAATPGFDMFIRGIESITARIDANTNYARELGLMERQLTARSTEAKADREFQREMAQLQLDAEKEEGVLTRAAQERVARIGLQREQVGNASELRSRTLTTVNSERLRLEQALQSRLSNIRQTGLPFGNTTNQLGSVQVSPATELFLLSPDDPNVTDRRNYTTLHPLTGEEVTVMQLESDRGLLAMEMFSNRILGGKTLPEYLNTLTSNGNLQGATRRADELDSPGLFVDETSGEPEYYFDRNYVSGLLADFDPTNEDSVTKIEGFLTNVSTGAWKPLVPDSAQAQYYDTNIVTLYDGAMATLSDPDNMRLAPDSALYTTSHLPNPYTGSGTGVAIGRVRENVNFILRRSMAGNTDGGRRLVEQGTINTGPIHEEQAQNLRTGVENLEKLATMAVRNNLIQGVTPQMLRDFAPSWIAKFVRLRPASEHQGRDLSKMFEFDNEAWRAGSGDPQYFSSSVTTLGAANKVVGADGFSSAATPLF